MVNLSIVTNVVGILLIMLGGFMLTALPFSYYFDSNDSTSIIYAAVVTFFTGLTCWFFSRKSNKRIGKREGFLIVGIGWLTVAFFCSLPYWFSNVIPEFTNSFFESVS